jgi:protein-disulfide isomerase
VYKELGNDTFWKFHHALYSKQPDDLKYEKINVYKEDFLLDVLKDVTTNEKVAKVKAAFAAGGGKKASDKDKKYADSIGVQGTPAMFIDGKEFTGKNFDDLKKAVNEASKK